jgi:Dockerin type I domain
MSQARIISSLIAAMRRGAVVRRPSPSHGPVRLEPLEPRVLLSADALIGDANLDGQVDDLDIALIKQQWNVEGATGSLAGDLNSDGFVGLEDLNLVLGSPDLIVTEAPTQDMRLVNSTLTAPELGSVTTVAPLFTDFNDQIAGNWLPTFERNLPTIDPAGQPVVVDQPRWGAPVGTGVFQPWEQVLATDAFLVNIGQGPGADGQWLSVWHDPLKHTLIAFNHDLSQSKTLDLSREQQTEWLALTDQEADTRYVPKTGRIVPGGLWMVYLQREDDLDLSPTGRDWTPVGTSFGVAQEVTFDNIFDRPRGILDSPRAQGLIDSRTGLPYENIRGQEWALSITPIVVNGRVEKVWWTITDYLQDPTVSTVKPGGSTWVILAERDPGSDHYQVRQPRLIEQQEDPLGPDMAFEHRHSAITVVHETGEVDVVVSSGDTAPHAFLKRYRIDDPANYETSSLTVQDTGFLGITGEASPKLISFQVGSAPDKIMAATDGRDEGVLELTIPLAMDQPASVRSVIGRGFVKMPAMTVNLALARPWERSGYAVSVRPFLTLEPGLIPELATSIFYSDDGADWVEMAANIDNTELVFHDDWLVVAGTAMGSGIRKTQVGPVDPVSPLLISPGGTQRLNATLSEQTGFADTDVVFLEKVGGLWVDNGVPLDPQPPTFGPVVKISRTGTPQGIYLSRIYLSGPGADFQAGGFVTRSWVMPTPGFSPYLTLGLTKTGLGDVLDPAQPTATGDWLPVTTWSHFDPNLDGSDYVPLSRLSSQFNGVPHRTEFYIAYDLLLNEADVIGTVASVGDIDHDAFVGLQDLSALLGNWNATTIPPVIEGDLTDDGFVGISDLNTVLSNWNSTVTPGELSSGDPTGDGFVGIDDLSLVLSNWNSGDLPPVGPLIGDINQDRIVGIGDLNLLLQDWNVARPTTGIVPGYPLPPSDTQNLTGDPEKLVWDMPASTNGNFTVALAMSVPVDGIDATWGEDTFKNGSTNYGSIFLDENNRIELWHHRQAGIWSLEVTAGGKPAGTIKIPDAWLNIDGRLHWVISYDATQGLRFSILQRGNEVAFGSLPLILPFTPTTLQVGSHDWLSVPVVGILSAYYNPSVAESQAQMRLRVLQDAIYQTPPV